MVVTRSEVPSEAFDGHAGAAAYDAEMLVQDGGLVPVDSAEIEMSWIRL